MGAEALLVVAPLALYLLWRRRSGLPLGAADGAGGRLRAVVTMVAVAATAAAVLAACAPPIKKVPPLC